MTQAEVEEKITHFKWSSETLSRVFGNLSNLRIENAKKMNKAIMRIVFLHLVWLVNIYQVQKDCPIW